MRVLTFEGSPQEIGRGFGEACRDDIAALYAARVDNAIIQAKAFGGRDVTEADVVRVAEACVPIVRAYHPRGFEELEGIAEGANLPVSRVWAMNALTDLRDVLSFGGAEGEGCTSFIVRGQRGFIGQTWDLATDNMPYVLIVRRKVDGGPATACLTLSGCLSLIGMNEHGLSIGTTNIRSRDSRAGVGYLDIIHKYLAQSSLDAGIGSIVDAPRAGAHYYFTMDDTGRGAAVECSATQAYVTNVEARYVHANHILHPDLVRMEAATPSGSSANRQRRMEEMIASESEISERHLMHFLSDHEGGEAGICRHDFDGVSSNGAVILEPGARRVWAVHGQACQGEWIEVSVPHGDTP